ncbi:Hypothetical predicted protein [Pelobates cultripes]|uniref:Uncharacterized protein n=1 Tax=Pelobates cultripes TaxID=61616 RepID=A0AAD1SA98_PELCU|nr:Hypothetical predicted protein [Pelobates cultripes]
MYQIPLKGPCVRSVIPPSCAQLSNREAGEACTSCAPGCAHIAPRIQRGHADLHIMQTTSSMYPVLHELLKGLKIPWS